MLSRAFSLELISYWNRLRYNQFNSFTSSLCLLLDDYFMPLILCYLPKL